MARAVYSHRFIGAGGSPMADTTYTVPAGFVAVVRDITALVEPGSGILAVQLVTPAAYLWQAGAPASGIGNTFNVALRAVIGAGEQLLAFSRTGGFTSVLVSGYLLSS